MRHWPTDTCRSLEGSLRLHLQWHEIHRHHWRLEISTVSILIASIFYTAVSLWNYQYIRKVSAVLAHNFPEVSCNFLQPPTKFRVTTVTVQSHIYPSCRIIYPSCLTVYNIWNLCVFMNKFKIHQIRKWI
jgi:hypothetical protein